MCYMSYPSTTVRLLCDGCVGSHRGGAAGQVRKVMSILARLPSSVGGNGGVIQDDPNIVIKKQIASSHVVLKRVGVVGAVVGVQAMVVAHTTDDEDMGQPVAEAAEKQVWC